MAICAIFAREINCDFNIYIKDVETGEKTIIPEHDILAIEKALLAGKAGKDVLEGKYDDVWGWIEIVEIQDGLDVETGVVQHNTVYGFDKGDVVSLVNNRKAMKALKELPGCIEVTQMRFDEFSAEEQALLVSGDKKMKTWSKSMGGPGFSIPLTADGVEIYEYKKWRPDLSEPNHKLVWYDNKSEIQAAYASENVKQNEVPMGNPQDCF